MPKEWIRKFKNNAGSSLIMVVLCGLLFAFAIPLSWPYKQNPAQKGTGTSAPTVKWQEIDRLISEQKFEAALQEVEKLRIAAQKNGNTDEWTRTLIKEVQLRTGMHGYETAVRFLKDQPWPDANLHRAALNLFYARALVIYYQGYSWEINQREKVSTNNVVDLKAWTRDQIYAEAQKAYTEVWKQRVVLGGEPTTRLAERSEE